MEPVTKKEIVKQISVELDETQLRTKEIVQLTFDAIVKTLLEEKRIELRNFGVFEVKRRKARKARNPRTGQKVDVPPKNVVTFKPGKKMEEAVRQLTDVPDLEDDENEDETTAAESETTADETTLHKVEITPSSNGVAEENHTEKPARKARPRKKAAQS
jgi:nucleoid DNA-binding protein